MKKTLKFVKLTGIRFRATGATFWLGIVILWAVASLHPPVYVTAATALLSVVWALLCVISCIPSRYFITEKGALEKLQSELQSKTAAEYEMKDTIAASQQETANVSKELELTRKQLIKQLYFRITEQFRLCGYDKANWEFVSLESDRLLLDGKSVRLSLQDTEEYTAANVIFNKNGALSLELIKNITPEKVTIDIFDKSADKTDNPEETAVLKNWLDDNEAKIDDLCFDAFAKGKSSLVVKTDLPDKKLLPRLCNLLEAKDDYESVDANEDGIKITLKQWKQTA